MTHRKEQQTTMPTQYQRKTHMGQSMHEAMMECVQLVLNDGKIIRKVAAEKGISKSVLSRYITKYNNNPTSQMVPNYKHSQVFTTEEEHNLEEYLVRCSQIYHGQKHFLD